MSSENLNINVNPLEEKSDKIEFTVDKMGLSNPAQTIPTDVDYFIRKQKGELDSKFTWSEALSKSFEIDNLFVSGINNFGKEDGYDISSLSIDGGMSNNRKFCQMISDILGLEILVPENVESTATGAAIVSSIRDVKEDLKDLSSPSYTKYLPKGNSCEADFKEWQKFVQTLDQQYK